MTAVATKSKKTQGEEPTITDVQNAIRRAKKAKQRSHARTRPEQGNLFADLKHDQVATKLERMRIILKRDMTSSSPTFKIMLEEAATVYLSTFNKTRSGFMGRHVAAKKAAMALVNGPESLRRHADKIIEGAFRRG